MCGIRCLASLVVSLACVLCVFIFRLNYSSDMFTPRRHRGALMEVKMEQKTPNISQYISYTLANIKDPKKRHSEEVYFKSYMETRNKYIQLVSYSIYCFK